MAFKDQEMDLAVNSLVSSLSKTDAFKSLLGLLDPYISGSLSFSNIICSQFIEKLTLTECSPTGKVLNNDFVFKILKLYQSFTRSYMQKNKRYEGS